MKKAVAISFVGNAVPPVFALITAPVLAQGLGVDGRGEVAAATAPLLLCMGTLTIGIPEALTYFRAKGAFGTRLSTSVYLLLLAALGAVGTLAVWLISDSLAAGDSFLAQLTVVCSMGLLPALAVAGMRGVALGSQQWWLVSLERCGSAAVRLVAVFAFFATGTLTPVTAALAICVGTFVGGVFYLLAPPTQEPTAQRPRFRAVLSFGSRIWIGAVAGILLMRLSQVLMTPLAGVYALGIFAVAVNLSEAVLVFNAAVRDVIFATSAGARDGALVAKAARLSTLVTAMGGAAVALSAPLIVPALFGAEFAPAVATTWILLVGVVLGNAGSVAGAGLSGFGRPELRSVGIAAGLVVNIAAMVALVPAYGANGAALATLVGSVTSGWFTLAAFLRVSGYRLREFVGIRRSDLNDLVLILRRRKG